MNAHTRWLWWSLLVVVGVRAETPISPRAETLDLLVTNGVKPVRLSLRVQHEGHVVPKRWDAVFTALHTYLDRDRDGTLNAREALLIPAPFALRQVVWGEFFTELGTPPDRTAVDRDRDGKVSRDELADYYRQAGLGGIGVAWGQTPHTTALTNALVQFLDTDRNGMVSEAEWKAAATTLRPLDKNDDELIGPGELVAQLSYPSARAAQWLTAPRATAKADPRLESLPFLILPLRMADLDWQAATIARRTRPTVPAMDEASLRNIRTADPALSWAIRLDAPPAAFHFTTSDFSFEIRSTPGSQAERILAGRRRFMALWTSCDANNDQTLAGAELEAPKAKPFQQIAPFADQNRDGQLSADELQGWLTLQEQIAQAHVLLAILDYGRGLFEWLDVDHDGALSVRELRTAWNRLQTCGCIDETGFRPAKLPQYIQATVSHGVPVTALPKAVRSGPPWFQAMDRNNDGDISAREWVGSADTFRKLDTDNDGLLTATEAEKAANAKTPR